jgi:hypothetical protein
LSPLLLASDGHASRWSSRYGDVIVIESRKLTPQQVLAASDPKALLEDMARVFNISVSWVDAQKCELLHLRVSELLCFDLSEGRVWALARRECRRNGSGKPPGPP